MRLAVIAFMLIAGIFAGAQLGKIAPLVDWYQQELGFSLVLVGWLTSLIGIFVALAALPTGWAIDRFGVRRSVFAGSIILSAGALGLPFLDTPVAILAARLVEGIGYVVLVIALPAVMTSISPPEWRGPVLAIWSCFVPVGYAVSDLMAQALVPTLGTQGYLLMVAAGYVASAGIGIALLGAVADIADDGIDSGERRGALASTLGLPVVIVALAFGLFVVQSLAFFSFMPAYISGGAAMLLSAGVIVLVVPIGNVLATVLVRGGGARRAALLSVVFFGVAAAAAYPAFSGTAAFVATASAVIFVVAGGVVGSALYAAIPALVPRGGSVSIAIGLVAQAGGLGTLFGPPAAAYIIETHGWTGLAWFMVALSAAGILVLLPLIFGLKASQRRGAWVE